MVKLYNSRDPAEEYIRAFRLFDEEKSGKINLKNIVKIAREVADFFSEEELIAMINEYDKDKDGYSKFFVHFNPLVTEREFVQIMLSTSKKRVL